MALIVFISFRIVCLGDTPQLLHEGYCAARIAHITDLLQDVTEAESYMWILGYSRPTLRANLTNNKAKHGAELLTDRTIKWANMKLLG